MTIEEAIQHCEEVAAGETGQGKCPKCAAEHKQLADWLKELVALRAQQAPLDRSRGEGCGCCKALTCESCLFLGCPTDKKSCIECVNWSEYAPMNYCHNCGRPLTEEAWAELERRIKSETD